MLSLAGFPDITQAQRFIQEARVRDPYAHLRFVGRDSELIALWGALERTKMQTSLQEFWVVGEAGSGKTRLVREFGAAAEAQGAARVVWLEPGYTTLDAPAVLGELAGATKPLLLIAEQGPHRRALDSLVEASSAALLLLRLSRKPAPAGAAQLALPPLSRDACLDILGQFVDPALQLVTTSLVGETGGNPAYTIELGRTLSNARSGSFSGSLTSLLQARLDMLPQAQRYLLAQLALVGERSWSGLAAHLADSNAADSSGANIDDLLDEEFLVSETTSSLPEETELRFRSELLRRAALLTVPLSERPSLHERIAEWLDSRLGAGVPGELQSLLDHHRQESRAETPTALRDA